MNTTSEVQNILNTESNIPNDVNDGDLPAQAISDEKPKRKSRKKTETPEIKVDDPDMQNFKESTKRLSLQTVFDKMAKSEQKTVVVKEIKIEEAFDFQGSLTSLRKTFEVELAKKMEELNALYKTEIQRIKDKAAFKNISQMVAETVTTMSAQGWSFNKWKNMHVVSKYYTPYLQLTDCFSNEGWVRFNEPYALLKAIHLNYTSPKVSGVYVEVQGIHPNVSTTGNFGACTGTMAGREIDILNARSFGVLLDELERQYKFGNLQSAYNGIPMHDKSKYTVLKNNKEIESSSWC